MNNFGELLPWLGGMGILILVSAFFSGSEAALFYLRPADRKRLASGSPGGRVAANLLENPERLLAAILFWNLLVNIVYFALSSMVALRIERHPDIGPTSALAFAGGSLVAIILASELLPKSFAVSNPMRVASLVAVPLQFAVRLVDRLIPLLDQVNVISRRVIAPRLAAEPYLDVADLERAIALSVHDAALLRQEQSVLKNIVQLSDIRVDEWMRPRAQFTTFTPPVALANLRGTIPPGGYILVSEPDSEEIAASLRLDRARTLPTTGIERLAQPVLYLPWCATVGAALEKMSQGERQVTVVVNEHGETIGILTIDDILEGIFSYAPGPRGLLGQNTIHPISPGRWLVSGMLSLRRLSRDLKIELPSVDSVTVGGMIQEQMQRLAEPGDEGVWGPFRFRVVETPHRGVMLVELNLLEPPEQPA